tara:strand:- start:708 stop:1010 length:303 start_codon:yes stop_codon:yes gene_type:complete
MIVDRQDLCQLIYDSVDEVNQTLPASEKMKKSIESILVGEGGVFDSLSIVNFLVSLESGLSEKYGAEIILIDEETLSDAEGPNKSLQSLSDHIIELLVDA